MQLLSINVQNVEVWFKNAAKLFQLGSILFDCIINSCVTNCISMFSVLGELLAKERHFSPNNVCNKLQIFYIIYFYIFVACLSSYHEKAINALYDLA